MYTHKFQVGQQVELLPALSRNIPGGFSEIRKQLPERGGEFEYQIKSISEPHIRVVRESELRELLISHDLPESAYASSRHR
jgi:hypothetical protein